MPKAHPRTSINLQTVVVYPSQGAEFLEDMNMMSWPNRKTKPNQANNIPEPVTIILAYRLQTTNRIKAPICKGKTTLCRGFAPTPYSHFYQFYNLFNIQNSTLRRFTSMQMGTNLPLSVTISSRAFIDTFADVNI